MINGSTTISDHAYLPCTSFRCACGRDDFIGSSIFSVDLRLGAMLKGASTNGSKAADLLSGPFKNNGDYTVARQRRLLPIAMWWRHCRPGKGRSAQVASLSPKTGASLAQERAPP